MSKLKKRLGAIEQQLLPEIVEISVKYRGNAEEVGHVRIVKDRGVITQVATGKIFKQIADTNDFTQTLEAKNEHG